MSSDRRFDETLDIHAPPAAVWKALSEGPGLERWFAYDASVEPRVGGQVVWNWDGIYTWKLRVEAWQPERHLRLVYDYPLAGEGGRTAPLWIDFQLEGKGGATRLRVVHSGFGPGAEFDAEFDGISGGWPVELQALKHALEVHPDRPRRLARARRRVHLSPLEAIRRLHSADGMPLGGDWLGLKPGDAFEVRVPGLATLHAEARIPAREDMLAGTFREHGVGWYRTHAFPMGDPGESEIWLLAAFYETDADTVSAYDAAFEAALERCFPGAPGAARPTAQKSAAR